MLNVYNDQLAVESKGIYSIENYLTSRRLMYWQVYLHKTAVAYEKVLVNALMRAKELIRQGNKLFATPALQYFLSNDVNAQWFADDGTTLSMYQELDDNDIWSSLKVWKHHEDVILSTLSADMVERRIFKVEVYDEPIPEERIDTISKDISSKMGISINDAKTYMMNVSEIQKDMYDTNDDSITILYKDDVTKDISDASELLNVQLLSKKIRKYYLCYQRI